MLASLIEYNIGHIIVASDLAYITVIDLYDIELSISLQSKF